MAGAENLNLPDWVDRYKASRVAQLRSMGFTQVEIAEQLGMSQQMVSRYMAAIKKAAKQSGEDWEDFLWSLLLIGGGIALTAAILNSMKGRNNL